MVIELDLKKLLLFLLICSGVIVVFSIVDSIVESVVATFGCLGVLAIWVIGIPFVYWSLTGKTVLLTILFCFFNIAVTIFFIFFLSLCLFYVLSEKNGKKKLNE